MAQALAAVAALGAVGCAATAGTRPATASAAAESERALTELRAKNTGYARRVDELQNRVIILEDQLAARRAAEATPSAPKPPVRIVAAREDSVDAMSSVLASHGKPAPQPPAGRPPAERRIEDGGSSVVSDEDVEYGGEALGTGRRAARGGGHRPMLRLHGAGRRAAAQEELQEELAASSSRGVGTKASRMYKQALTALRAGRDKKALSGFRRFIARHPRHELADDAQFWIAECYYGQRDLQAAEAEYRRVIEKYPKGSKVPDAMLKLGLTLTAEGESESGRQVLESLARAFPKHDAGRTATTSLASRDQPAPARPQPKILGTIVPAAVATTAEAQQP